MAKTVEKPTTDQPMAVADPVAVDPLASQAASDQVAKDQQNATVAAMSAISNEVPAAEIAAAGFDLKGPEGVTLVVKGPLQGRWRAGRHFGPEPVSIPASELTVAEAQALADDTELMISVVQEPL